MIKKHIKIFEELLSVEFFLSEDVDAFNQEAFLSKLRGAINLAKDGIEGEKIAAKAAVERLMDRAKKHAETLKPEQQRQFLSLIQNVVNPNSVQKSEIIPNQNKPVKFQIGDKVIIADRNEIGEIENTAKFGGMVGVRLPTGVYQFHLNQLLPATEENLEKIRKPRRSWQNAYDNK